MGQCCKKPIVDNESESDKDIKDLTERKDIPLAEAVEVSEAVNAEFDNPEDFYGQFNYAFTIGQSEEDKTLAGRKESPDDRIVDLLLIMDCTSSMSSWLRLVRRTLKDCIETLKEENPELQVRVSFLGFRDITDKDNIFVIQDFTFDLDKIKTLISETPARGGGDVPEDVQGALFQGKKLSWREVSVKICYICTDAPCHGKAYHSLRDNFPNGNPAGLILEELTEEYSNMEIDVTVYQLTGQTKNMYDIMEKSYNNGKNKDQFQRITLEKEIKQVQQEEDFGDMDDGVNELEERMNMLNSNNKPIGRTKKPMAAKKRNRKRREIALDRGAVEQAYVSNFNRDLQTRAINQYARHGWSRPAKKSKMKFMKSKSSF